MNSNPKLERKVLDAVSSTPEEDMRTPNEITWKVIGKRKGVPFEEVNNMRKRVRHFLERFVKEGRLKRKQKKNAWIYSIK